MILNGLHNLGTCYDSTLLSEGWSGQTDIDRDIFAHLFVSDITLLSCIGSDSADSTAAAAGDRSAAVADMDLPEAPPSLRGAIALLHRALSLAAKKQDVDAQIRAYST